MKAKTAFESGNSPPMAGRGVEDVKRRIMEAFEKIHNGQPGPTKVEKQPKEAIYTEVHEARFHARAKQLLAAALTCSYSTPRGGVFEIVVPKESAEELIAQIANGK